MYRNLDLYLNKFDVVPHALRIEPAVDKPNKSCQCDLARLYHHYYLDSYGKSPPNPDPAQFEYIQFLSNCDDFRIAGDGLGVSTTARRISSTNLGQAFCRWFLHDHLNIKYFAHMDRILNKNLHRGFGSLRVVRSAKGDVPDYFCAENVDRVFLAEAKGRYSSISFKNKEFNKWRNQFNRVEVCDAGGNKYSIKGYIVGTRFATERNGPNLKSGIFAEDPRSPGEEMLSNNNSINIGSLIIRDHYSNILMKLDQPLLAAALSTGSGIPDMLQIQATLWQFNVDALKDLRFVGGYWPSPDGNPPFAFKDNKVIPMTPDPLRLDNAHCTFFGVEESIFRHIARIARLGIDPDMEFPSLEDYGFIYSAISLLRDGTLIAPAEFLFPNDMITV